MQRIPQHLTFSAGVDKSLQTTWCQEHGKLVLSKEKEYRNKNEGMNGCETSQRLETVLWSSSKDMLWSGYFSINGCSTRNTCFTWPTQVAQEKCLPKMLHIFSHRRSQRITNVRKEIMRTNFDMLICYLLILIVHWLTFYLCCQSPALRYKHQQICL